MINVTIDVVELAKKVGNKVDDVIERAVSVLGEFAVDRIRQISSERLKIETWQQFAKSVQVTKEKYSVTVFMDDKKMAALETGHSGFDIKKGLLKGPKVKHGKNGPYQDVPLPKKVTLRGKGDYVEPRNMRQAINKAVASAKKTGENIRVLNKTENPNLSGIRVTPQKEVSTFRRVSENSNPESWMHPGYDGLNVFETVAKEIEEMKDQVTQDIADSMS